MQTVELMFLCNFLPQKHTFFSLFEVTFRKQKKVILNAGAWRLVVIFQETVSGIQHRTVRITLIGFYKISWNICRLRLESRTVSALDKGTSKLTPENCSLVLGTALTSEFCKDFGANFILFMLCKNLSISFNTILDGLFLEFSVCSLILHLSFTIQHPNDQLQSVSILI